MVTHAPGLFFRFIFVSSRSSSKIGGFFFSCVCSGRPPNILEWHQLLFLLPAFNSPLHRRQKPDPPNEDRNILKRFLTRNHKINKTLKGSKGWLIPQAVLSLPANLISDNRRANNVQIIYCSTGLGRKAIISKWTRTPRIMFRCFGRFSDGYNLISQRHRYAIYYTGLIRRAVLGIIKIICIKAYKLLCHFSCFKFFLLVTPTLYILNNK